MVQIKQLTKDDVFIVHQLANDIWPLVFKDIISEEQIKYMLDWMYDINTLHDQVVTGHLFYLLTFDGIPKGFIGLEPNYPEAGTLRIHKLYVHPDSHGNGLGQALLTTSMEVAKEMDAATINLNVNRFNEAVKFYERNDFSITKEEDIKIGRGYLMEDYVMVKTL